MTFKTAIACLALFAVACVAAPSTTASAQSPSITPQARVEAYLAALSSGDAATFESAARDNLSPELFATRTPEQRQQTLQRIHGDFGRIEIVDFTVTDAEGRAQVRGQTGLGAVFVFGFDPANANRITRVNVEVRMGGGGPSGGPNVPPAPLHLEMSAPAMESAIDTWIAPFVAQDDFAGVIMVAREGRPYVTRAYGPADRSRNRAADTSTAYNIASIGKRFTQTGIARLIQEGRITLNSTVGELLPDYPNADAHSATIGQLINMQGGVADIFAPERATAPREQFSSNHGYYTFVSSLPQRFAPGSRTEYCNGCYVVLGEIIERLSGTRFEDYMQRHVFTPAGMTRTGYFRSDRLPANTAIAYERSAGPGSPYAVQTDQEGITGSGAGGLYSTAGDLLAFDNALRDGRLLNAEQSAWVLGGQAMPGRNTSALAIQGGGPGASAVLNSNGRWSIIVTSNVTRPLPFQIAQALATPLQNN